MSACTLQDQEVTFINSHPYKLSQPEIGPLSAKIITDVDNQLRTLSIIARNACMSVTEHRTYYW